MSGTVEIWQLFLLIFSDLLSLVILLSLENNTYTNMKKAVEDREHLADIEKKLL